MLAHESFYPITSGYVENDVAKGVDHPSKPNSRRIVYTRSQTAAVSLSASSRVSHGLHGQGMTLAAA